MEHWRKTLGISLGFLLLLLFCCIEVSLSRQNKGESEKGKELQSEVETTFHPVDCFQACYYHTRRY